MGNQISVIVASAQIIASKSQYSNHLIVVYIDDTLMGHVYAVFELK